MCLPTLIVPKPQDVAKEEAQSGLSEGLRVEVGHNVVRCLESWLLMSF